MLSLNCFENNFKEHAELFGWKLAEKRVKKIYYWLNEQEFNDSDLLQALKNSDTSDFRFSDFLSSIRSARTERLETEQHRKQQEEEDDVRHWFKGHQQSKQECINLYQCGTCKLVYCDIVAATSQAMLRRILSGQVSGEEAHQELAEKLHGIGFEQHMGGIEPF
ncbi:MAG: hypothetical protein V1854_07025 [Methanobacteriota archaeon]